MAVPGMVHLVNLVAFLLQPLYSDHSETARKMTVFDCVSVWYIRQANGSILDLLERTAARLQDVRYLTQMGMGDFEGAERFARHGPGHGRG